MKAFPAWYFDYEIWWKSFQSCSFGPDILKKRNLELLSVWPLRFLQIQTKKTLTEKNIQGSAWRKRIKVYKWQKFNLSIGWRYSEIFKPPQIENLTHPLFDVVSAKQRKIFIKSVNSISLSVPRRGESS